MSRIKTIGFSLKAFSAKLQRLPFSYRIAGRSFLLAVVLLNSLLMLGCLPTERGGTGMIEIDGFVLKEVEMENVRFEPQGLPFSIQPAYAYWLRRGDTIAPKWDTHEWHWERKGAMCDFPDNTSAGDCQVCDYCNEPPSTGPPCMGARPIYLPGALEVVADSGFIQADNPQVVLSYIFRGTGDVLGACANNTDPSKQLIFFEPATSGFYRLRSEQTMIFRGATNGEIKLHVVETGAGLAQKTAYQLTSQSVDSTNYWTWTIEGNPLWLENFSPNLRVTDIRILRGGCADGSAQGKQCAIPDDSVPVKPSRLLFLPNFIDTVSGHPGESQHRCYSNPNASDGNFINLDSCLETYNATQTIPKPATPAYEPAPGGPLQRLTWLVEFNTNEGADADLTTPGNDPMPPDAVLIIEFTIQAN